MNDERFLKDWLRDATDSTTDPNAAADKVVARIPDTPQRRRWLSWPPARRPKSEEPNGRTRLMLSPSTTAVAGALSLAIVGVLLISRPFGEPAGPGTGAETDGLVPPVRVSGSSASPIGCTETDYEGAYEAAGVDALQFYCSTEAGMPWSFDDPRLEGTVSRLNEESRIELDDAGDIYLAAVRFRIENDDGTWEERPRNWIMPDGYESFDWQVDETIVFDGSGDYEGLVAVLRIKDFSSLDGFILDERMLPPSPEQSVGE